MMTQYRVRAYSTLGFQHNYFKVQQWSWRGWKTIAKDLYTAEAAAAIIRGLLEAEREFEEMDDDD